MKIIFLDVDGVLNSEETFIKNQRIYETTGKHLADLDEDKISLLKEIVEATDAKIILSSTWRYYWRKEKKEMEVDSLGRELDKMLNKQGLYIFDKTPSLRDDRGIEIITWLSERNDVTNWIVIDDEIFDDFEKYGILPRLVKADFYGKKGKGGGLQKEHVKLAISLLDENKNLNKFIK